jgi:hypothetical protein
MNATTIEEDALAITLQERVKLVERLLESLDNLPEREVEATEKEVQVRFDRRAHLPIVLASGILDNRVDLPWWNGVRLRPTA